jgi:hypothetical protein
MSKNKHNAESEGAKPRDHAHPPYHFLSQAHRDWRVWVVVALMLACMVIYILTDNESLRPGNSTSQPMPANSAP